MVYTAFVGGCKILYLVPWFRGGREGGRGGREGGRGGGGSNERSYHISFNTVKC